MIKTYIMKNYEFKRAVASNREKLLELIKSFHQIEHLPFDEEDIGQILSLALEKHEWCALFVIEMGKELVGYALVGFGFSIEYGGRDAMLDELFIIDEKRGYGLGNAFLNWIMGEVRMSGVRTFHLEVDSNNQKAFDFYHRMGFRSKNRKLMSLNSQNGTN